MRDLSHLLKTKNHTGNTGNTGNAENAEPERNTFRYIENRKLPEMENGVNLVSGETSLCGQMSFEEMTQQEPHREERRYPAGEMPAALPIVQPDSPNAGISSNPADYQGPDSFETCFQKCLAEISRAFDRLPWVVRFDGTRPRGLAEILGPDDYNLETETQAEINRLWSLGLTQDEAGAAGTYQEFRAAVIRWYRLWKAAIDRHKRGAT